MSIKFCQPNNRTKSLWILLFISLLGLVISLVHITDWVPFFSDQVWFYNAANNSLLHGGFLLFGLRSSIYWLHHGALWMYILLPALWLTDFHPLTAHFFTVFLNLFNIPLIYYLSGIWFGKKTGLIASFIFSFSYIFILFARFGYHISLIPLLFLISALCLVKKRYFLSGLFLAFFYQVHLLAVIYWPLAFLYLIVKKAPFMKFILGSLIGIIPFLLSGPVQTFGIIVWLAKYAVSLHGSVGISSSESMVVALPLVIVVSVVLSRLNRKILYVLSLIYFIFNLNFLISYHFYPPDIFYSPDYSSKLLISRQILDHSRITAPGIQIIGGLPGDTGYSDSYTYLLGWLQKRGLKPSGVYSKFVIDENTLTLRMLE